MKTLEELYVELERLQEEIKLSIMRYDPRNSAYIAVHSEDPPFMYWVLEKPLRRMSEVRYEIYCKSYVQKDVDK